MTILISICITIQCNKIFTYLIIIQIIFQKIELKDSIHEEKEKNSILNDNFANKQNKNGQDNLSTNDNTNRTLYDNINDFKSDNRDDKTTTNHLERLVDQIMMN